MGDTMVLDMDTTDIPMLTMARGLLTLSPRLKLILTSSMVDITVLVIPDMVFIILPMVAMLIMERDLPMLSPRLMLTPTFFMVYHGLGYHGLGYGYHGYPYAYYGKRSADA